MGPCSCAALGQRRTHVFLAEGVTLGHLALRLADLAHSRPVREDLEGFHQ